jgi:hypothetical protein
MPQIKQILNESALGKADWKTVDKKIGEFTKRSGKGGQANLSDEGRALLHRIRETAAGLPNKATPTQTEQALNAFLDGVESYLKQRKPVLW